MNDDLQLGVDLKCGFAARAFHFKGKTIRLRHTRIVSQSCYPATTSAWNRFSRGSLSMAIPAYFFC